MEQNNQIKKKIIKSLLCLIEESTIHGLPRIIKSELWLVKLVWLVCFLASASYCAFMAWNSIASYLKYDVITSIETFRQSPSNFPSITLCNYNQYQYLDAYFLNFLNSVDSQMNGYSNFERNFLIRNQIISYNDTFKQSLSFDISEMLLSCKINNENCNESDFSWIYHPLYGNCYQFNTGKNKTGYDININSINKNGINNGLKLELFIGDPTVSVYFIEKIGFHLMINNQTYKLGIDDGYDLPTGFHTSIGINRIFNKKLPDPYNECILDVNSLKNLDINIYNAFSLQNKLYRQSDCFDLCYQKVVITECNCYLLSLDKLTSKIPCLNASQIKCSIEKWNEFLKFKSKDCSNICPLECESMNLQVTTSFANYPSPKYGEILIKNSKINSKLNSSTLSYESIKKSVVSLSVYYEQLVYTEISEQPKAEMVDLVSNIGGLFGLFLGLSFLSFVEIFEGLFTFLSILLKSNDKVRAF